MSSVLSKVYDYNMGVHQILHHAVVNHAEHYDISIDTKRHTDDGVAIDKSFITVNTLLK